MKRFVTASDNMPPIYAEIYADEIEAGDLISTGGRYGVAADKLLEVYMVSEAATGYEVPDYRYIIRCTEPGSSDIIRLELGENDKVYWH